MLPSSATAHVVLPTAPPASPRRILVAEDEHLLARNLCNELTGLGYDVIGPAPNGRRAIELASVERPDMALLDIRMPEMDGLEAGRVLYQQMHVPIVILSAYSDSAYVDSAAGIGVFGYLLKPINLDDLRVTLPVAWGRFLEQTRLVGEVHTLEEKLENRKIIERAKGLIMKHLNLSEEEAMRRLQKQARDSRRPMVELAKAILDTQGLLNIDRKADA